MNNPPRNKPDFEGKVAIVTGAGSRADGIGNGRAAAILLAEAGCNVVLVDMNIEWAKVTEKMIEEDGKGKGISVQADVTIAEDCQRIVNTAVEKWGRVDILINNVGITGATGTVVDVDIEEWERSMRVNVTSMVLMSKYSIPVMLKNPGEVKGSIVNMSSVAGLRGGTPHALYPTSKGAIVNLTRAMAANHGPQGIRVNCVCPGMAYTPMMYADGMSEETRIQRKNRSILRTEGNGWDIGAAVKFLASGEARWLTGVILPVDAGATCTTGQVKSDW